MAYDYLGRRVQKVVEEYSGSSWAAQDDHRFVYLGWNVIEERHTSGGVSTKKNFVWGLRPMPSRFMWWQWTEKFKYKDGKPLPNLPF